MYISYVSFQIFPELIWAHKNQIHIFSSFSLFRNNRILYTLLCNLLFSLDLGDLSYQFRKSFPIFFFTSADPIVWINHNLPEKFLFHGYLYFFKSFAITRAKCPISMPFYTCMGMHFGWTPVVKLLGETFFDIAKLTFRKGSKTFFFDSYFLLEYMIVNFTRQLDGIRGAQVTNYYFLVCLWRCLWMCVWGVFELHWIAFELVGS